MYNVQPTKNTLSSSANNPFANPTQELPDSEYHPLILQIEGEYQAAKKLLDPKVAETQKRLKLYNNQRRDKDVAGDTLLYTTMQTMLASFYEDRMAVEFAGRTEGDEDLGENLNILSAYDYDVMRKDVFDYFWLWDTLFFGRSIVYMTDFDRDRENTPIPDLQNPLLFLRDPKAVAINGYIWNNRNACRFFGRWIEQTKPQMQMHPEFRDIDVIRASDNTNSDISINRQAYQTAQGLNNSSDEECYGDNKMYDLLEWCTNFRGRKVLVTLANDRKKVVRYHEVKDGNNKPALMWPALDRPMSPMSHDWDGVSVPDITEDKQRIRAILKNLGIKHLKADLYPMYAYNKKAIKNESDLNFGFNKAIPVEGSENPQNAIWPIQKAQMNAGVHQYIMDMLATDVERATATPEMQQGTIDNTKRTATELNKVDRNVGTRFSLSQKIFGWSEREFWRLWYQGYKLNFSKIIDEKIVRVDGAFGTKFRKLTHENIIRETDPDIKVVSTYVRNAEMMQKKQDFAQYLGMAAQLPGSNVRYGIKKMGKLIDLHKDEIDRLIPPTIDERIAEAENIQLSQGIKVLVNSTDDHLTHLEIHAKAADTSATFAHIKTHEHALTMQKDRPDLFPSLGQDQQNKSNQQQNTASGLNDAQKQNAQPASIVQSLSLGQGGGSAPTQ